MLSLVYGLCCFPFISNFLFKVANIISNAHVFSTYILASLHVNLQMILFLPIKHNFKNINFNNNIDVTFVSLIVYFQKK